MTWSERVSSCASNEEIDARLEAAEIQRRVCAAGGPALSLSRASKAAAFRWSRNLFGTIDRARFLFRDTPRPRPPLVELKLDPRSLCAIRCNTPARRARRCDHAAEAWVRRADVAAHETTISQLPQLVSWPDDGGAFITLPQVYTETSDQPGWRTPTSACTACNSPAASTTPDREVGLHYQIHRSHRRASRGGDRAPASRCA